MPYIPDLLTEDEIQELESALDTVINQKKGYGKIVITVEKQKVKLIEVLYSVQPGKMKEQENNQER